MPALFLFAFTQNHRGPTARKITIKKGAEAPQLTPGFSQAPSRRGELSPRARALPGPQLSLLQLGEHQGVGG